MPSHRIGRIVRSSVSAAAVAVLLLTGCGNTVSFPSVDAPMKTINPTDTYRLEPGNRVRVTVFNETNLSGDFIIDPAGNVALPLMGNIPASGITAKALTQRIEEALKKEAYLREPRVAVEVQTFRPFYVLGEVRQPGEFPYMTGMTVLSAIAKAGGYDYRAREGEVVLVRQQDEEQKEYRANERTPILPGDIVRVTQRRF
ncbi:polysaccharide biosynthesis/export family protein [Azospirillum sp. sgz301742]